MLGTGGSIYLSAIGEGGRQYFTERKGTAPLRSDLGKNQRLPQILGNMASELPAEPGPSSWLGTHLPVTLS